MESFIRRNSYFQMRICVIITLEKRKTSYKNSLSFELYDIDGKGSLNGWLYALIENVSRFEASNR